MNTFFTNFLMEAVATIHAGTDVRVHRKDTWFEKHQEKQSNFTDDNCLLIDPIFSFFMVPELSVTHKLRCVLCGKRDDHTLTLLCDAHADA
jgi:hypothetical protein